MYFFSEDVARIDDLVVFCLDGFADCLSNLLVGSNVISHPSVIYMELLLSLVQYFRCVLSYAICFASRIYFLIYRRYSCKIF